MTDFGGFCSAWIELIEACITNCYFSVIFQGVVNGYFPSTRGLRQGDSLSPSQFILAQDVLSRALNLFIDKTDAFSTTLAPSPSHLLLLMTLCYLHMQSAALF